METTREIFQAIQSGKIKRLYMSGHSHRLGQTVSLLYTDAPPVRCYKGESALKIREIVDRFNRRFGQIKETN